MKECQRCGGPLNRFQFKWCSECEPIVRNERDSLRRKKKRFDYKVGYTPANSEHHEWEANICLNCTQPVCNNCLVNKSAAEKGELLKTCGGKAWLN